MHVQVKRWDALEGIFRRQRFYYVSFTLHLTEDEHEALKKAGLDDWILRPGEPPFTVQDALRQMALHGARFRMTTKYSSSAEASIGEQDVKERLDALKGGIENVYNQAGAEEYEL